MLIESRVVIVPASVVPELGLDLLSPLAARVRLQWRALGLGWFLCDCGSRMAFWHRVYPLTVTLCFLGG